MPTVIATPGDPNANSYLTVAEATAYFDARLPITPSWLESAQYHAASVIMATRVLDALAQPFKVFVPGTGDSPGYYRVRRLWTGAPATTTQRLAWPRTGMFDQNGNPIPSNVIPQALKEATAELAGQLLKSDRTLDLQAFAQGVSSVKAGSVAVSFKDTIVKQTIPEAVYDLLVQSWLTDEIIEPVFQAEFEVL